MGGLGDGALQFINEPYAGRRVGKVTVSQSTYLCILTSLATNIKIKKQRTESAPRKKPNRTEQNGTEQNRTNGTPKGTGSRRSKQTDTNKTRANEAGTNATGTDETRTNENGNNETKDICKFDGLLNIRIEMVSHQLIPGLLVLRQPLQPKT